ncbi:MAG: 3-dehydroquinate synthase [Bacteroidales bacterium]|nr:3-dehydroquinate synthase [Bacteroidales bacterium]
MKNNVTYGHVADLFPRPGTVLIADDWFRGRGILEAWNCPTLWIHAVEEEKTLATVERLVAELLALQADRSTMLVGVGGGITTDITGFTAAIYKRGVPCGLVPTTLLAQVDAALGGKNGVNFDRYKNMVGTFREPAFVYVDTDFLQTLPPRELRCGAAEMLKTFLLADAEAYEAAVAVFSGPHPEQVPERLIRRAAEIKLGLVEQDPEDRDVRQLLNLGHTFGHAIEKCSDQYLHGEAVSIGIVMAARLACEKQLLDPETAARIARDFAACGLPVEPPVPEAALCEAILQDKKRTGETLRFVLPVAIGKAILWESSVTA